MPESTTEFKDILKSIVTLGIPPGASSVRKIDVGTEEFLRFFEHEIIETFIAGGGATCRFFEGVYGSGKSHLLQLLQGLAISRGMLVIHLELSAILNLSLMNWKAITSHILSRIRWHRDGEIIESIPDILFKLGEHDQKPFSRGMNPPRSASRNGTYNINKGSSQNSGFINDILLEIAQEAHKPSLKDLNLPHAGFVNAIDLAVNGFSRLSANDPAKTTLKRFLCGEKVTVGDLRRHGIKGVKNPLSDRNAESVLNTVISAMFELGFTGTMILFDETDQTFNYQRHSTKAIISANLMRRLIDGCSNGVVKGAVVVFAVLPNFLPSCAQLYPALGDRLLSQGVKGKRPGWRFPVLRLDDVTTCNTPEMFLNKLVEKFVTHVRFDKKDFIRNKLLNEGK
jgi:hypothetical protein